MLDKTKIFILKSYLKGLYLDLKSRLVLCPECEFTLQYIEDCLNKFKKIEEEDNA